MNGNEGRGIIERGTARASEKIDGVRRSWQEFRALSVRERTVRIKDILLDHAMLIIILLATIFIAIMEPRFLSVASIVNIISLTAAKLPLALGIGGAIILTGTDISAGRAVGLTACITASLLQVTGYGAKMFPNLPTLPIPLVILVVVDISRAGLRFRLWQPEWWQRRCSRI